MTELQWLIKILTKEKLSAHLKDLFIERIGEVESALIHPPIQVQRLNTSHVGVPIQAPSTQRILEEIAANPSPPMAALQQLPKAPIDKETGRAIVSTGRGTMGPRKF